MLVEHEPRIMRIALAGGGEALAGDAAHDHVAMFAGEHLAYLLLRLIGCDVLRDHERAGVIPPVGLCRGLVPLACGGYVKPARLPNPCAHASTACKQVDPGEDAGAIISWAIPLR